jgi:poly(3-hydroxybutyrate) depolymerase
VIPFTIRFNQSGEIDDFLFDASPKTAGYQTPSYVNSQAYTEKEVVINEGRWALPGTLTLPTGQGMHPVVVLVHGSGPDDRDESFYALKPFRDLALGLASQGIAVLRYEKRSLEYPVQLSSNPKITIKEEAQDDAQAAISLLSKMEGIDPNRIYVLGHSQGGFMMPRLLAADTHKQIAGTILMSAPSGTLSALIEKQYSYLVSLKQAPQQTLDYFKAQFALLNDPGFSPDHPPQGFTLPSMYWWNDLRNYEPAQTAKLQTGKMLVLQGGRDYQVTADNLDIWKDALKERTDVVYHLYPKLNHFYTEGEGGLSTPAEYLTPGNIPAYVINDIVHWVNQ